MSYESFKSRHYGRVRKERPVGSTQEELAMMGEIDQLYNRVGEFRSSAKFREMVGFVSRFRHLAPYNAMLVGLQRPGCRMALTAEQWAREYHRVLRPNAQPLIYLNMRPVGIVYDIGDTMSDRWQVRSEQEIMDEIARPFESAVEASTMELLEMLYYLEVNLPRCGIAYDPAMIAADSLSGRMVACPMPSAVREESGRDRKNRTRGPVLFTWTMPFLLSVNKNALTLQSIQAICHELGHFFCHHLPSPGPDKWWENREVDTNVKEFEAETVSYMVCKRCGIPCPASEKYLANYVETNDTIPQGISMEAVIKAVFRIEKMLEDAIPWTDSLLYTKDPKFKERFDKEKALSGADRRK